MEVNVLGMTTAPTGQSNQAAYDVTDDGIIDGDNDVPANADAPIDVTLVGIVTDVSDEHPSKAADPSRRWSAHVELL